jgi:CII-binding regulator of phage lambda lysogenization HflD
MKHQLDDHEKKRQMVQNMAQLIGDLKKQGVNTGAFESRLNAEVAMLFSDADRILRYGPRILIDGKPVDIAQTGPLISEPPQKPDAPRLPNQPDSSGTSKQ